MRQEEKKKKRGNVGNAAVVRILPQCTATKQMTKLKKKKRNLFLDPESDCGFKKNRKKNKQTKKNLRTMNLLSL